MFKYIFLILFLLPLNSYSQAFDSTFKDFYNDSSISPFHCGRNILNFLQLLKKKDIPYKKGYVVSLHEPYGELNHFDARWGRQERYTNGIEYYRSNWYFHVFLVIDNKVYDFSQAGAKIQSLYEYLNTSYFPKYKTEPILMQGQIDKEKAFLNYANLEMNIYKIDDYLTDSEKSTYQGSFIELIALASGNPRYSSGTNSKNISFKTIDDGFIHDPNTKYVTIQNPRFLISEGEFPLKNDSRHICRSFGYFGSLRSKSKFIVTDKIKMLKLYSNIKVQNNFNFSTQDMAISFDKATSSSMHVKNPEANISTSVTCSELATVLRNI